MNNGQLRIIILVLYKAGKQTRIFSLFSFDSKNFETLVLRQYFAELILIDLHIGKLPIYSYKWPMNNIWANIPKYLFNIQQCFYK